MNKSVIFRALIDVGLFMGGAAATSVAQHFDRPITAVLVFLTGVILIAVHSGMAAGLVAAAGASLVYNFFLSQPVYQFGITSTDTVVPIVAFNMSALLAGAIVGRLKDAAGAATAAQSEMAFLLKISDRLQRAIKVEQLERQMHQLLPAQGLAGVEIFVVDGSNYLRPATGEMETDTIRLLLESGMEGGGGRRSLLLELQGAQGVLGLVKFRMASEDQANVAYLKPIAGLLALAVERCLLLKKVAEAQALEKSEELKDAILSSVSHDLRTPITAIEAAASALTTAQVTLHDSDRAAMLKSILEQCRRLDRYTTELLHVGEIRSGISVSSFDSIELAEIIGLAINHARNAHPSTQIKRNQFAGSIIVHANAAMLEQAIFNVLDNACKFGGECGPVEVQLETTDALAKVIVSDLGPGIAESDRPHLFDRFYKSGRTKKQSGSGLGLYIAKGFIEAFAGSISVENRPEGKIGAQFSITLPVVQSVPDLRVVA